MCTEYLVDVISHFGQYRLLAQALSKRCTSRRIPDCDIRA